MRETSGQNGIGKNQVFPEKMGRIRNFYSAIQAKNKEKNRKRRLQVQVFQTDFNSGISLRKYRSVKNL